jgi:hypothetical protein
MSKMKELDSIAEAVADNLREVMMDSISWSVNGTIVDKLSGDEYYEACNYIIEKAVENLAMNIVR